MPDTQEQPPTREYQCYPVRRKCQRNNCVNLTSHSTEIIGTTEFRGKNAQKEHLTQRRQQENSHFWPDDKRIVGKQTLTQTLKDKPRQAIEEDAPAHVIAGLGKSHAQEKQELLKLQHQMRQKIVTETKLIMCSLTCPRALMMTRPLTPGSES